MTAFNKIDVPARAAEIRAMQTGALEAARTLYAAIVETVQGAAQSPRAGYKWTELTLVENLITELSWVGAEYVDVTVRLRPVANTANCPHEGTLAFSGTQERDGVVHRQYTCLVCLAVLEVHLA